MPVRDIMTGALVGGGAWALYALIEWLMGPRKPKKTMTTETEEQDGDKEAAESGSSIARGLGGNPMTGGGVQGAGGSSGGFFGA